MMTFPLIELFLSADEEQCKGSYEDANSLYRWHVLLTELEIFWKYFQRCNNKTSNI